MPPFAAASTQNIKKAFAARRKAAGQNDVKSTRKEVSTSRSTPIAPIRKETKTTVKGRKEVPRFNATPCVPIHQGSKVPVNSAKRKCILRMKLDQAKLDKNQREITRIEEEIKKIDGHSEEIQKQKIQPNRFVIPPELRKKSPVPQNIPKMSVDPLSQKMDDPFTRKRGNCRIVTGKRRIEAVTTPATSSASSIPVPVQVKIPKVQKNCSLAELHNIHLDIDFGRLEQL